MTGNMSNPMSEYLLKIQLIISNTEFKNKTEAYKYETKDTKLEGGKYVRAMKHTDIFESYTYHTYEIEQALQKFGYTNFDINTVINNHSIIPLTVKNYLKEQKREEFINNYVELNPYYARLSGVPFSGSDEIPADDVLVIPDGFYNKYGEGTDIMIRQPIHELSEKSQEIFLNSPYYSAMLQAYPDSTYLRYIGSNKIPIEVSRPAKDGDIMRINQDKLSTYHEIFGHVFVDGRTLSNYVNIYNKTKDYVYGYLKGDFGSIYTNYDELMRLLTIYLSIGNAMNVYMRESVNLRSLNNSVINNYFQLYNFPEVLMENESVGEFLKRFRRLLMFKGTNTVYRVKDIIGYSDTSIYSLIMVKQQEFAENGEPIYYTNKKTGERIPKQKIVFRRLGVAEENTSYFQFKNSNITYSLEEISSGDPRWWRTTEVDKMLSDMNYTLSNSKYIQLSTIMSYSDIWWQTVILTRALLQNKNITDNITMTIDYNINGQSSMSLYDMMLVLTTIMGWKKGMDNTILYLNDNNKSKKTAGFNYSFYNKYGEYYNSVLNDEYLGSDTLSELFDIIFNNKNNNIGNSVMNEVREVYEYIEDKVLHARTIAQYRKATELYYKLFLVNEDESTDEDETFDSILKDRNEDLYNFLVTLKTDTSQLVMLLRAIIKALENLCNTKLNGLSIYALDNKNYINILKEVITYFKSYMVEFTKEEFAYIFGGILDNGGNSDMLKLLDEFAHITMNMRPKDSLHLYDTSFGYRKMKMVDDNRNFIYDDALFRIKTTYDKIKQIGYDIWYDDGENLIDTEPSAYKIYDTSIIIADICKSPMTGENMIIINKNNIIDKISPNYYGNTI